MLSVHGGVGKIDGPHFWRDVAFRFFGFSAALALLSGFLVLFIYRHRTKNHEDVA